MDIIARRDSIAANGMTAVCRQILAFTTVRTLIGGMQIYYPDSLPALDVIPRLAKKDIVVGGGLHKDCKGSSSLSKGIIRNTNMPYEMQTDTSV